MPLQIAAWLIAVAQKFNENVAPTGREPGELVGATVARPRCYPRNFSDDDANQESYSDHSAGE